MRKALLALLPATALLYFPLAFEEFEQNKAFALVAFACFAVFFVDWRQLRTDRIGQLLALFVVSAGVSTVTSFDWHTSLFGNVKCPAGFLVYASYLVLYLALRQTLKTRKDANEFIIAILATSFVVAAYACLQVAGIDFKRWYGMLNDNGYVRPMSFLGHPNFMAGYLAMTLPFVLHFGWNSNKWLDRCACGAVAAISIAAIFFSQSRGMWIAAVIGVVVFCATSRAFNLLWALAAVGIIAACLATSPQVRATAIDRAHNIVSLGPARAEYPATAVRIWIYHPLFGTGTDTFEIAFQRHRSAKYWQIEKSGSPHKAHNDFLNTLATQGLFGAVVALILTQTIFLMLLARRKAPLFAPASAAVVAWYIEGLSSFTVVATGAMLLLCLVLLQLPEESY